MSDLRALLDAGAGRRVLVLGDLMLDHFLTGRVERISPEAPVPVVLFDGEEYRLGGAANVAHNLAALGASVDVAGVAGDDEAGTRLLADLARARIGTAGVVPDAGRCTTRKLRIVTTRHQQVARVDYECDGDIGGAVEASLLGHVRTLAEQAAAIVVSDYQKGTITPVVAKTVIEAARTRGIPVIVDPKVPHIDRYAGATLITPNHHEAEAMTLMRVRSAEDAREAARRIRDRIPCACVLITRGEHGMWLLAPEGEFDLPAETREVSDVTGAGDTVVAAIALGLAAGGSMRDAARLANRAAGLAVSRFGPTAISAADLRPVL